ncbi:hypothetical protein GF337_00640 [candidate division KSB1 bacterium]|nr:hypothetical protein [candidate division KSB1 bacterium]
MIISVGTFELGSLDINSRYLVIFYISYKLR